MFIDFMVYFTNSPGVSGTNLEKADGSFLRKDLVSVVHTGGVVHHALV